VTGPSHMKAGRGCDDAFAIGCVGPYMAAIVCDGAGSADRGADGATLASLEVVANLLQFAKLAQHGQVDREWPTRAIGAARERIAIEAQQCGRPLADYHCTAVGCIIGPSDGLIFHVGDGSAVAFSLAASGELINPVVSEPANGEYANETFFITQERWKDYVRLKALSLSDVVLLMSDGVSGFAMEQGYRDPDMRFVGAIHSYLDDATPEEGGEALAATLDRADARIASSDDKTLVWIRREARPPS